MFSFNIQSLSSFRTFLIKFSKETLAVTLLFQCDSVLVVGADNLIWQFYFYFNRICLINCNQKVLKVVNLIVVSSRKYRWPEHYFPVWSLRNFQKLLKTNQVSTIYFYNYKYFFFSLRFDLFSIIAKEVNQIRNNVVCVVARYVFLFCCALTMGRCNAFQHNFVN